MTIEEAARDLRRVIQRIFRNGDNAIITEAGEPIAEIVPARATKTDFELATPGRARIVQDELTGLPVIVPPKGTPPLTSEIVRGALADFP